MTITTTRAAPDLVLGIDLGTSSCKVGLFDPAGRPHGFAQAAYAIARAPDGQAEQWPEDWWQSVALAARQALADGQVPAEAVAAAGVSGPGGTPILVRRGRPARGPA